MSIVSYAQNFEDVLLWRALGDVEHGRYLDIGAQDPVVDSVSLAFYRAGWRGTHIEPTPFYAAKLREARPDEIVIEAAVSQSSGPIEFHEFPGTGLSTGKSEIAQRHVQGGYETRTILVPTVRLDHMLDRTGEVHWMKIDVEGMEADVLGSWGKSPIRPWVLVVEATFPNSRISTDHEWRSLLEKRGYREVHFDGLSRYFVHEAHEDLADRFDPPPNIFDGFQVTSQHFLVGAIRQAAEGERTEFADREAQLRGELTAVTEALRSANERAQSLEHAVEARELAVAAAEQARDGWDAAANAAAAAEREHGVMIARIWRERHEADQQLQNLWRKIERSLRDEVAAAQARVEELGGEIASLREREQLQVEEAERLAEEVEQLALGKIAASAATLAAQQQHDAAIDRLQHDRREEEGRLRAQANEIEQTLRNELEARNGLLQEAERARLDLEAQRANIMVENSQVAERLAFADAVIRKALAEPVGRWQRLGRTLRLTGGDGVKEALRSWDAFSAQSTAYQMEPVMHSAPPEQARNPYLRANSLEELLSWHDVDFVRCAYVTMLGRQPDPDGERYYVERVREGRPKLLILRQLRRSQEGRDHDSGIAGLDRELRRFSIARWPLFGTLASPGYAGEWSRAQRRSNRLENAMWRAHGLHQLQLRGIENALEVLRVQIARPEPAKGPGTRKPIENVHASVVADAGVSEAARALLSEFDPNAIRNLRKKLSA